MDLSQLDTKKAADEGFTLRLTHPRSGEPLPAEIDLHGVDSEVCQRVVREQQRRHLANAVKTRRLVMTPEAIESDSLDLLTAATRAWRGMELDGKPLEFSPEAARALYVRFAWIREQVEQAINDRANFLPASSRR